MAPWDNAAENNELHELLSNVARGVPEQLVHGVSGAQKAYLAALVLEEIRRPALYITSHLQQAETVAEDLAAFLPGSKILVFPPAEVLPYEYYAESPELTAQRLNVLGALVRGEAGAVVAPLAALTRRLLPPAVFARQGFWLRPGDEVDREKLLEHLVELGYTRVERVENRAEFAARGDILDVFPLPAVRPLRVELFDTEIDSLREFDPESQRSLAKLTGAWVGPAREVCLLPAEREHALAAFAASAGRYQDGLRARGLSAQAERVRQRAAAFLERAREGLPEAAARLLPFAYEEETYLMDYFSPRTLVFLDEPLELVEEGRSFAQGLAGMQKHLLEEGNLLPEEAQLYAGPDILLARLGRLQRVGLSLFLRRAPYSNPQAFISIAARGLTPYHQNEGRLAEDLRRWHHDGYAITLRASNENRAGRLKTWLKDNVPGIRAGVAVGPISAGFELPTLKVVEISDAEIFGQARRRERRAPLEEAAVPSFTDLKVGDLVVHVVHGIGRYQGVKTLESAGSTRDYLVLEYAGHDLLYVPTDQVHLLQKYIGPEGESPRLSKLGGNEWQRAKSRAKRSVEEMAQELLALYARRKAAPGYAFGPDTVWQKEFEDAFPYEETPDQLKAIEEVKRDMESPHPMDRLLCGDVGYGKTEVAIRAAFKAVMDGKQVAVLVPTTILAQQHYNTFRQRLARYPVQIEMLSRFRSAPEQREIIKRLKRGAIDIIIGTHRLVSKDVRFADLGLVIIDEEQRFGVRQKERLKELKATVDVLTLTATPIPRTLHLSMVGLRDMSLIQTPPEDRYPVQTYVVEYSDALVRDAIAREIGRGGQVFYLYNRVEGIEAEARRVQELVPQARVAVAHGQLSETRLARVVLGFLEREYDVLVCTSIIENGLDMPNVNTLVVRDADRLGLAQLYQLRGRVGRSNRVAYAYFTYEPQKLLSPIAQKRLQALREFTELGSGFKLAVRDLEIRGAGNILGAEQHGHIAAIGFEMYCSLLEEAVRELKGEKRPVEVEPQVDLKVTAYLPESYVASARDKMELYKAIAACRSEGDVEEVAADLIDRFGDPPPEVATLLEVARLKVLARGAQVAGLTQRGDKVVLTLAPGAYLTPEEVISLSRATRRRLVPLPGHERELLLRTEGLQPAEVPAAVRQALLRLRELVAARQVEYNGTND
ncbi:MAG TPA: transcription-repair coupling factor [Firmicutes bacterium]|nr:transcription-repair coupling factor [Bacillota bacterium]